METIQIISIPLSELDYQLAHKFAEVALTKDKQEQIYRNTLAILSGHYYCKMLGIPSQLSKSYGWDAELRQSQDVADLYIDEIDGRIECRPISKHDTYCHIPKNVQGDREGYIVIELDDNARAGLIRGFVPAATIECLQLSHLRSLDGFFERIAKGKITVPTKPISWSKVVQEFFWKLPEIYPAQPILGFCLGAEKEDNAATDKVMSEDVTRLYQIDDSPEIGNIDLSRLSVGDALSELIQRTQKDSIRWQAAELLRKENPEHPLGAVIRAKDLTLYLGGHNVALMIGWIAKSDGKLLVMARLRPVNLQSDSIQKTTLPEGIQLSGMQRSGDVFFEKQSGHLDDYIQWLFLAKPGSLFKIKVALGESSIIEVFQL